MEISAVIYAVPCIAVGLLFLWLPDSPHWLAKTGDYDRAKQSIAWYQPMNDADEELNIVKNFVTSVNCEGFFDRLGKFKSPPLRKAILLIIVLFTFMQITGLNSIIYYMETIIENSRFSLVHPSTVVICVHVSGIFATVMSMCLIDRCGRRFLLILSCTGVALAMVGLGSNSYLISINANLTNLQWLPVISIFLFIISYFIGLMSVPSTVLSEIFPSDVKCLAACVSGLIGAIWSFTATKSFQPLIDTIGETYVFWMHGFFALILIPYICVFMPETKGKSLQEIQDKFIKI